MRNPSLFTVFIAITMTAFTPVINAKTLSNPYKITQTAKTTFANGTLSIYFKPHNATLPLNLTDKARPFITATRSSEMIGISSYASSIGDAVENNRISKNRVRAVQQFLKDNGISSAQIKMIKPANTVIPDTNRVDVVMMDE